MNITSRFRNLQGPSVVDELCLKTGTMDDYKRLASFHYKSGRPGAVTAVYSLVHRAPSIAGRFLQRPDQTMVVGVLLRCLPHLACQLRDQATGFRYRNLTPRASASMINHEFRTIARVIIHPQWRGLGLAVRLVKHALSEPETIYTEALAAMGRVHPFFERSGMIRYDRPLRPEHVRLEEALYRLGIDSTDLASISLVRGKLEKVNAADQQWIESELRRWNRTAFRIPKDKIAAMNLKQLLIAARDKLLVQPVYYLMHHN